MFELQAASAAEYLSAAGRIEKREPVQVRELAGGVSNMVLLVELPERGERFVLKQARARLRVAQEWLCPLERIWREADVLRLCREVLQASSTTRSGEPAEGSNRRIVASTPRLLWEDRENYAYAMSAAPPGHHTWKELLLAGEIELSRDLAVACAELLALLHASTWNRQHVAAQFDDRSYFEQLRIEPYYRWLLKLHPDRGPRLQQLIDSLATNRRCLVHGDFSPKNLLVWPGEVMLIDFEVGHFGDPAFDLGFFLTHLLLKSIWAGERGGEYQQLAARFWETYQERLLRSVAREEAAALEGRMLLNLAGCLLARVDGKSPVDYLNEQQRATVRTLARDWLAEPRDALSYLSTGS
jgi:5-methylthioribose kinase